MPGMKTTDVETALQKAFGIDIDALIAQDPGSAHNLREEWGATVEKVEKFVNHVSIQAKAPGPKAAATASQKT